MTIPEPVESTGVVPASGVPTWRLVARLVLAAALALAYLWPFRLYGLDIVDEGTLLSQIRRVSWGGRPYLDFHTGYTPGYFALQATLWRLRGHGLVVTRTFGIGVHAFTIALLFALARRRAGALVATCAAVLYVAFLLPISLRFGAPFNVPYPGWVAAPIALLAAAAIVGIETTAHRLSRLITAGAMSGLVFLLKLNAGALTLGGVMLALAGSWPNDRRLTRGLAAIIRLAAVACAVGVVWPLLDTSFAAALVVPVALAAWHARPSFAESELPPCDIDPGVARPPTRPLRDLALLAASFLVVVMPWLGPPFRALGGARFAREVLLIGAGVEQLYVLRFAPPGPATLALCAGLALACMIASRTRPLVPPEWRSGAGSLAILVALALACALGAGQGARLVAENAILWLPPLALTLGFLTLGRGLAWSPERVLLSFAALYQLQLYPRVDVIHVAMGAPPLMVALAWQWQRFVDRGPLVVPSVAPAAERGPSRAGRVLAVVLLVLAAGRAAPAFVGRFTRPIVRLDAGPRGPLLIEQDSAASFAWLGDAVRRIETESKRFEPVFFFPDLAVLGFLSGHPAPFFFDYFVPGRPDHEGERKVIELLERFRPRLAVVGPPRVPAFQDAPSYFADLEAYLATNYRVEASLTGCDILVRRDAGEPSNTVVERRERDVATSAR